jgi:hypothetical protein
MTLRPANHARRLGRLRLVLERRGVVLTIKFAHASSIYTLIHGNNLLCDGGPVTLDYALDQQLFRQLVNAGPIGVVAVDRGDGLLAWLMGFPLIRGAISVPTLVKISDGRLWLRKDLRASTRRIGSTHMR